MSEPGRVVGGGAAVDAASVAVVAASRRWPRIRLVGNVRCGSHVILSNSQRGLRRDEQRCIAPPSTKDTNA